MFTLLFSTALVLTLNHVALSLPLHVALLLSLFLYLLLELLLNHVAPEISQRNLIDAELALLNSIQAGYEERWVRVKVQKADFLIHSIHVRYTGGKKEKEKEKEEKERKEERERKEKEKEKRHTQGNNQAVEAEDLEEFEAEHQHQGETNWNFDGSSSSSSSTSSSSSSSSSSGDNHDEEKPRDIVVIHGHSAGVGHWESICDGLSSMGNLHLIDLPGWGRSTWPAEVQNVTDPVEIINLHMEVLIGWMKAHGLDKVVVLGHSFGAMLGVHLATRCPDHVVHLMIVSPAGLFPVMPDTTYHMGIYFRFLAPQRIARVTGRLGYVIFKTMFLRYSEEDRRFPDYYYQLAAATARHGAADGLFGQFVKFRGTIAWWSHPITSLLMNLACPLTIIWGELDPVLPARFGPILHRLRPQTDVHIIKNSKHNPAHSSTRSFLRSVMTSIEKHVPRGQSLSRQTSSIGNEGSSGILPPPMKSSRSKLPLFLRRSSGAFRVVQNAKFSEEVTMGQGVGFCHSCLHEVHVYKSYWRCGCGAWSFNAFSNMRRTREDVERMLGFLEELYVAGSFDARNSQFVTEFLSVKTPLFAGDVETIEAERPLLREESYIAGELLEFD